MKNALRIVAASAFVTALLIKAVPALAEPAPAQNVTVVRTTDLDLSKSAGQRELDRRLVIAAGEVCGSAADVDLAGRNDARQCRQDVLAQAREQSAALIAGRALQSNIRIAAR